MIDLYLIKFKDINNLNLYKNKLSRYRLNKVFNNKNVFIELALIKILEEYQKIDIPLDIYSNNNGKIYLNNFKYYFNISHSKDYLLIGISDKEIGVDIEFLDNHHLKLSKKIMNDYLFKYYTNLEDDKKIRFFYKVWTLKESYIKNKGLNLINNNIIIKFYNFNKSILHFNNDYLNGYSFIFDDYMISYCSILDEEYKFEILDLNF